MKIRKRTSPLLLLHPTVPKKKKKKRRRNPDWPGKILPFISVREVYRLCPSRHTFNLSIREETSDPPPIILFTTSLLISLLLSSYVYRWRLGHHSPPCETLEPIFPVSSFPWSVTSGPARPTFRRQGLLTGSSSQRWVTDPTRNKKEWKIGSYPFYRGLSLPTNLSQKLQCTHVVSFIWRRKL